MSVATTTAIGIAAGVGVAGSLGGAAIASSGANKAASTQANAANNAAQLERQSAQDALNFQKQQYANQQQQLAPWLKSGTGALANLDYLMGIGGTQGVSNGETFLNPTQPNRTAGPPLSSAGNLPGQNLTLRPSAPNQPNNGPVLSHPGMTPTALNRLSAAGGLNTGSPNPLTGQTFGLPNRTASPPGSQPTAPAAAPGGGGAGYTPPANLSSLVNPGLGGYGSLMTPWTQQFQAPTAATEQNDPGFQFRLDQGTQALQKSAAARGGLLTGGTARDLTNYAQDYASNEYGNVYNRALGQYQQDYNIFQQNQANQFNRLSALSGTGQTAAGQLNSAGQSAANNVSSILMNSAAQQGQQLNNAGAASASGYAAGANAYGGALSGIGGNLGNLALLSQLGMFGSGGGSGSLYPYAAMAGG